MKSRPTWQEIAQQLRRGQVVFEYGCVALAIFYVLYFFKLQFFEISNRYVLEWDARAFALPAWRYHNTGLFPNDLLVDFMAAITPLGPKIVYWVGTLFTDPYMVSKGLPFVGLAVMLGFGYSLGLSLGGRLMGAGVMVLLCQCTLFWDRMVGGNPRAFGFPLLVVFLRYAVVGNERGTLISLFLQAICYPSTFVVCAPAYGLTLLPSFMQNRNRILRLGLVGLLAIACIPSAWGRVDPRIGSPPTYAQAATLRQMQPGGAQPFYPLPTLQSEILRSAGTTLGPYGEPAWPALARWNSRLSDILAWLLFAGLLTAAFAGRVVFAPIFGGLWLSSFLVLGAAHLVAYRLFLPERLLTYTWPILFRLGALEGLRQLLAPRLGRAAAGVASLGLCAVLLACYGGGLSPRIGLHDWRGWDSRLIQHIATLPKDVRIAAQPRLSTYIQVFARRQAFISATTNMLPHGYQYGLEMERRFEAFYRAYYSPNAETLSQFAREQDVQYMAVDTRDFGTEAFDRARYADPWTRLCTELLSRQAPQTLFLAHPPPACVVFSDGPQQLVDLRCLTTAPAAAPAGTW